MSQPVPNQLPASLAETHSFWLDNLTAWQGSGDTLTAYALSHGMPASLKFLWQRSKFALCINSVA